MDLNAVHKQKLNWLSSGQIKRWQTVSDNNSYTLNKLEGTGSGVKVLTFPMSFDLSSGQPVTNDAYWIEYRQPASPWNDYVVEAGTSSGTGNAASIPVAATSLVAQAPSGTYYVRVRPRNACGSGWWSNEVVTTVN